MATRTQVIPEIPAWIVWDELTASEQATLLRMWNESVDEWLEWAIGFLDKEPPYNVPGIWWDLERSNTYITSGQLEELQRTPPGDERRQCLFRMFADSPGSTTR